MSSANPPAKQLQQAFECATYLLSRVSQLRSIIPAGEKASSGLAAHLQQERPEIRHAVRCIGAANETKLFSCGVDAREGEFSASTCHQLVLDIAVNIYYLLGEWCEGGPRPQLPKLNSSALLARLRSELDCGLRNAAVTAAQPVEQEQRLVIDVETCSVTLDGDYHGGVDIDAIVILKALWEKPEQHVSSERLARILPGHPDEKAIRRRINLLPVPLQKIIKGKRGTGRCIELPKKA